MKTKKTSSILRKFLLFNLSIFSVLGLFTILYLNAIQPNLVKKVSSSHFIIINNTTDHIERLGVDSGNIDANHLQMTANLGWIYIVFAIAFVATLLAPIEQYTIMVLLFGILFKIIQFGLLYPKNNAFGMWLTLNSLYSLVSIKIAFFSSF